MAAIAFDTMKLVRRLEAAGMDQPQATGVAEALAETMVVEPATRADLQHLDARLTGEIAALRTDMQRLDARLTGEIATLRMDMQRLDSRLTGEIAGLRSDMQVELLRWILPLFLAQMALIIGVLVRLQP